MLHINHSEVIIFGAIENTEYSTFQKRLVHHFLQELLLLTQSTNGAQWHALPVPKWWYRKVFTIHLFVIGCSHPFMD